MVSIFINLTGQPRLLKALYEALLPDNVKIPEGMNIEMLLSKDVLKIEVSGDERVRIDTFISTLDEVLEVCSVVEKTVEGIGDARSKIY